MQRLKNVKIGVIFEAGISLSMSVRKGLAGVLREDPSLRLRLIFPGGHSEEARRTLKMLQWFLPKESEQDCEIQEIGKHMLEYPVSPDIIFLVIYSGMVIPPLRESMQLYQSVPVLLALVPDGHDLHPAELFSLFHYPHLFWVPFGWFPLGSVDTPTLITRTDLWGEACYRTYHREQLSPRYLEYMV